jgi:hypothetical protein
MKECNRCGLLKPFSEFSKNHGARDGYKNQCRTCQGKAEKARRAHPVTGELMRELHIMSPIERIRTELSLVKAWRILGLRGEPVIGKDLHSPFRKDKSPSFTIYRAQGHLRWHDHALGQGGDVIDLWAAAKEISIPEAIREIERYLDGEPVAMKYRPKGEEKAPEIPPERFRMPPDLRLPT